MDDRNFDRLTRILCERGSRRDVIGPIAGPLAALASLHWLETSAKRKGKSKKKRKAASGRVAATGWSSTWNPANAVAPEI